MPDTTMANGAVTLKDNVVTLHVDGAPDAMINAKGELQVGDKTIATTPPEQGLLMLYYGNIADVHDTGTEMGKVGAGMGKNALQDKLNGKSKEETDKDAENGAAQLKTLAKKMCQDHVNMLSVQNQLAAQLPEFKPYGKIFTNKDEDVSCNKDD
ncbi:hypothetical protein GCM10007862_06170 [Dyella lipolytica]|nr:hypothetical protein GCM10007862_06170 [Dyella lipolytica]